MRLLSRRQAKNFGLDKDYPSKTLRDNLTTAIGQIREFLHQAPLVSDYPHRMGVVCTSNTTAFVAETHPMPLRDWSTQHNPRMLLPLEPMAETARSYHNLEKNVFNRRGEYNTVEELLIFDAHQYCDGNGRFGQILQGRNQGYYRNLVLVGSRAPHVSPGTEPPRFRRWEWTPEELALLRGQCLRYPQVEVIAAPELAASHAAALAAWATLEKDYRLDLSTLRRLLPLFYRLLLPPDNTEGGEVARQLISLCHWAEALWSKQSLFSQALIYEPRLIRELSERMSVQLMDVGNHLRKHNSKYERLRAILSPADGPAPSTVVLVVSRRELDVTQTALRQALTPSELSRLKIVDGSRMSQHLRNPALNQDRAVWVLASLRVGGRQEQELSVYRRLLLARADVRLLAYKGIEQERFVQIERMHLRLVSQAIQHPDRAHFTHVAAPVFALSTQPLPGESSAVAPTAIGSAEPTSIELNNLFGDPGDGSLLAAEADSADEEDWGDDALSVQGQQCLLHFTDQTNCQTAYGRAVDVALRLPTGAMLGRRLPGALLPGDEVLLLRPDGVRLMNYLRRQDLDAFAAIDAAAACWVHALRRLYQRFDRQATRLHQRLRAAGMRPSLATVERWLVPGSPLRFPRAKISLLAIAQLEQEVFGATAELAGQLTNVLAQRRRYNVAVRKEANRNSVLLFDAYVSGDSDTASRALGHELFHALRGSVKAHVFARLELL